MHIEILGVKWASVGVHLKIIRRMERGEWEREIMCKEIFFKRFYLFIFRQRRRLGEKEGENINVWSPLTHLLLGTWPVTQACSLTGNQTSDPLVHRPLLNPLSHTSQGGKIFVNSRDEHVEVYCNILYLCMFHIFPKNKNIEFIPGELNKNFR